MLYDIVVFFMYWGGMLSVVSKVVHCKWRMFNLYTKFLHVYRFILWVFNLNIALMTMLFKVPFQLHDLRLIGKYWKHLTEGFHFINWNEIKSE